MTAPATVRTQATPDVCTTAILVEGELMPATFHLLSVTVQRELNRIPSATLRLQDGEAAKATFPVSDSDVFVPGKAIEVQLGYRSHNDTVFKGIIVKQQLKLRRTGGELTVECFAEAVKLTGGRKRHYFADMKDSDVMEQVLGAHGLSYDVEGTEPDLKEVVQYDATDWDFLLCRAEANGQVVLVADDQVKIRKPDANGPDTLQLAYGATLLELDVETDARVQSKAVTALSWGAADQEPVRAEASEPTTPAAGNLSASALAGVLDDDGEELVHGGGVDRAQLKSWADARLMRMRMARLRGRARCQGFAGVQPGDIATLEGIGERFAGKLYVSGVRQNVSGGNWETDVQFGLSPLGFAERYELRPLPAAGLVPAVSGLQMGVVTQLEEDPAGEDRIKCRLPLISQEADGIWARLATLDAGNERGTFYRPELGDEVVVGFLGDDPRYPVILGQCHSSAKPAPQAAKDVNHLKGYVSREKLKLTFDDDKKVITVETPAGNSITVSDDGKGIVLRDQNGNKVVLDDKGITVESAKDLTFKASGDVKLSGTNAEFSAQSSFKASGAGSAELSGAQTKINGDTTTVIKGGLVQIN